MYGEDIDLSYRVKKTGFKNYYFSDVTILHFKGESTKRDSPEFKKHFFDAMSIFIDKHIEGPAIKRKFLHWGVQFFKKIAFFSARKIAKTETSILVGNKEINMLIVANQTHFNEMIQLLKTSPNPICISGRISNVITDTDPCSGHLDHLNEVVKSTHANAVLFCESPELSYYKIIDVMKANPNIASYFIHSEFSPSIIGSSFSDDWSVKPNKINESDPTDL
jgi:hypothetical protein